MPEEGQGSGITPALEAAKTLEEAQRQKETAWSQTMDEMEESINTHGFYFARFGSNMAGHDASWDKVGDSRALVIKDRIKTAEGEGWIVITREGPKFLSTANVPIADNISKTINQRIQEEIELASNGQPFNERSQQGWSKHALILSSSLDSSSAISYGSDYPGVKLRDASSLDLVQMAVNKSRENAEMSRERMEDQIAAEQAKASFAQNVTSFIKDLPPKA